MKTAIQVQVTVAPQSGGEWKMKTEPLPNSACDNSPGLPFAAKHCRVVYCPEDERLYHFGGDFQNCWQPQQSGCSVVMSVDPRLNDWRIDTPFVIPSGEMAPEGMDEVAVCWDYKRKGFWLTSGFQQGYGKPNKIRGQVMFMDLATKKWSQPFGPQNFPQQSYRSMYDAQLDRVLHINYFGNGLGFWAYQCSTGTWSSNNGPGAIGIKYDQTKGQFRPGSMTHHLIDRNVYAIDSISLPKKSARVMRVDADRRQGTIIGNIPEPVMEDRDIAYLPDERKLLVWARSAKSYLIDIETGAMEVGTVPPPTANGVPFPPYRTNYFPPAGELIIGWNVWDVTSSPDVYWRYMK